MTANPHEKGFILIESLIAMVVTAIALLGLAALQAKSLQRTYISSQRTIATIQANDLVERMWGSFCALPTGVTDVKTEWENSWKNDNRFQTWNGALDATAAPLYKITITWSVSKVSDSAADTNQSFVYNFVVPDAGACP